VNLEKACGIALNAGNPAKMLEAIARAISTVWSRSATSLLKVDRADGFSAALSDWIEERVRMAHAILYAPRYVVDNVDTRFAFVAEEIAKEAVGIARSFLDLLCHPG
jgi:hypothetical protein